MAARRLLLAAGGLAAALAPATARLTFGSGQRRGRSLQWGSECNLFTYLKFEGVSNNNLGGLGPSYNDPEGLTFNCTAQTKGQPDQEVNLEFHATSATHPYTRGPGPSLNGMEGEYGSIGVKSGSQVDLKIMIFDAKTHAPLILKRTALTFYDLDEGEEGTAEEFVIADEFTASYLSNHSEVNESTTESGRTKFEGTTLGIYADNPTSPWTLSQKHKERAVSLVYEDTSEIDLTLGASKGTGVRFFNFVSWPTLLCDEEIEIEEQGDERLTNGTNESAAHHKFVTLPPTTRITGIDDDETWFWPWVLAGVALCLLPLLIYGCLHLPKKQPAKPARKRALALHEPAEAAPPEPPPKKKVYKTVLVPVPVQQPLRLVQPASPMVTAVSGLVARAPSAPAFLSQGLPSWMGQGYSALPQYASYPTGPGPATY